MIVREPHGEDAAVAPSVEWSLHPLTPWAEHDLDPTRVGFEQAHEYQLDPDDLVADDDTACQRLGGRLLAEQAAVALEVPSAALPGTRNLVIFGARAASPYAVDAVGDVDVPTTVTAETERATAARTGELVNARSRRRSRRHFPER